MVDNGSAQPVDPRLIESFGGTLRIERIDAAPPSPVRAANPGSVSPRATSSAS